MKVYALLLFGFSVFYPLRAQFPNYLIDSAATDTPNMLLQPSVAINLKNQKYLLAGAVPGRVYRSDDYGFTWTSSRLPRPYSSSGNTMIRSSFKGKVYYGHLSRDDESPNIDRIVIQEALQNGQRWGDGKVVGRKENTLPVSAGMAIGRKGTIYLAWTEMRDFADPENCKASIWISKAEGGKKFSRPLRITAADASCRMPSLPVGVSPAVTNDGKVFVAWCQDSKIWIDRSFDGGNTWLTQDITVTHLPEGDVMDIPGIGTFTGYPILEIDRSRGLYSGTLYLIWTDAREGHSDIWFIRSFNMGDNWTFPVRIHSDDVKLHQFMPAMTVDPVTGIIYIAYYELNEGDDNRMDVCLAWSVDQGNSFRSVKISKNSITAHPNLSKGRQIAIAAFNQTIVPVWIYTDGEKNSIWNAVINQRILDGLK
jgi:hypothetical protein